MKTNITGLHHVTAMTSDAQENLDFYAGILGLRLVKKTVNFDATDVYHFYYGNRNGDPGTLLTFFPYPGMPRGRKGNGQVTVTSFSIPENSINYWKKRLSRFNVNFEEPEDRFNETSFILRIMKVSDSNLLQLRKMTVMDSHMATSLRNIL
jgi:glyoxalase family protein